MRPGAAPDLGDGLLGRLRLLVGALGGDRVVRVDHHEDAGREGDVVAADAARVAGAVVLLVVVADDLARAAQEVDLRHDLRPELGVAPHDVPLLGRQRAGLREDRVGDLELPDVVEHRAELEVADAVGAEVHLRREARAERAHALAVVGGRGVLALEERREADDRAVVGAL